MPTQPRPSLTPRRFLTLSVLAAAVGGVALPLSSPQVCFAQVDAASYYTAGKEAFAKGDYAKARDSFAAATQTDPKNAETFLWLGKAQYQLGQLDEAIAAWNVTLQLAPNEPYAATMLAALRGRSADADTTLKLIDALLAQDLPDAAGETADRLLASKALTDAQRARAMTLRAASLLAAGRVTAAEASLNELLVRYPNQVDPAQAGLLLAEAKLAPGLGSGGDRAAEGVAALRKIAAGDPNSPAPVTAQYDLAAFDLDQGVDAAKVGALAKWLGAHADHARADKARRRLVDAYLALAARAGEPAATAPLGEADVAALNVAADFFKRTVRAADADKITASIIVHLENFYAKAKAYPAAIAGIDALLKDSLPPSSRLLAVQASARFRGELAAREVSGAAVAGKLDGAMPKSLAEAVAAFALLRREFPADPAWREQAALAERVHVAGIAAAWPAKVVGPKPAYAWAVELAIPVIKADADAPAVEQAVKTLRAIVSDAAGAEQASSPGMALAINGQLLAALSPQSIYWPNTLWQQVALLDVAALNEFNQNLRAGKAEANAKLSDAQARLIAALAQIVAIDARQAGPAVQRLQAHLQSWLNVGDYGTAEEAYSKLAAAVPEAQQREIELAVVNLWVRGADAEANRLAAAGLVAPHRINDSVARALARLYELQAGLSEADPFLARVRATVGEIVAHYKQLGYDDLAEAAVRVKAKQPNPAADTYAQFGLAQLRDESARRDLAQRLTQYKGAIRWTLTDPAKAAVGEYEAFVKDHPADPLALRAAAAIFSLAQLFAQYGAFDVAAGVYRDFAAFAATQPALSQAPPGQSSLAERAQFEAAGALDAKAKDALTKALAARKPDMNGVLPPPAKLSDDYAAAVAAYRDFIRARPQSPLSGAALARIMAVALDYARGDAWDVADGVYASLVAEADGPKDAKAGAFAVRAPERIELCRGLCQVGKVMPDHAKEMLAALSAGPGRGDGGEETAVATMIPPPALTAAAPALPRASTPSGAGGGGAYGGRAAATAPAADTPAVPPAPMLKAAEVAQDDRAKADSEALAAISRQEARRASQIAGLRDQITLNGPASNVTDERTRRPARNNLTPGKDSVLLKPGEAGQSDFDHAPNFDLSAARAGVPALSKEELARQQAALDAAYQVFSDIRRKYPHTATAEQARGEVMVMLGWWRGIAQWEKAVALGRQFLTDNPADPDLPRLRLNLAQDGLAWSAQPAEASHLRDDKAADGKPPTAQSMLAEVTRRFAATRDELAAIPRDFPEEKQIGQEAQWNIATSFLTQARVVDLFSATLARGQFVRAAKELNAVADRFFDHPNIAQIPQMLWDISQELAGRGYYDEAITVWNDLSIHYPTSPLSLQAGVAIAQTYQTHLGRPLRAAELYLELNFAHGGDDVAMQNAVFAVGEELRGQKRWVEALRVLQLFVDSFPRHANAGQALAMVGQIHQTNEAWADAIAAYRRVIAEYPASGQWAQQAKWSIADCVINLSQWKGAIGAYQAYVAAYPGDAKVAEANRRISVLKDLANYQTLVDEKGSKAYDAQYQIASIVQTQLANAPKAIVEYQKVAANYPTSHLAAEALYAIGTIDLAGGEVDRGRDVLRSLAAAYPNSPRADSALFQIGKSYEDESKSLSGLSRELTLDNNKDVAQRGAYQWAKRNLSEQRASQVEKLLKARVAGKKEAADYQEASNSFNQAANDQAYTELAAQQASQTVEVLTTSQLADRQDKVNAALRKAVAAYHEAATLPGGDKAGEALSRMAAIYGERLGDPQAAMSTWLEIVRQFSGTSVAEEASWQIAQHYEKAGQYAEAVESYKAFLRNYRRSPKASEAQFFIAENYEHLNQWVNAMDQYSNYLNNFPEGPLAQKAREQISFIKTYRL